MGKTITHWPRDAYGDYAQVASGWAELGASKKSIPVAVCQDSDKIELVTLFGVDRSTRHNRLTKALDIP